MQVGPVGQTPPASAGDRKYRDKSSPFSFYPLHPGFPRSLGQTIRGPSYGWPLLPSLEPNFRRGPKEGCSGERGSAEVVRGGGGAPSPGMGGKRERRGEVPETTGPGREERPPPAPQRSKSWSPSSRLRVLARPRRLGAHGRNRERPLPRPKGVRGESQGQLWLVGRARGAEIRPSAEPQSPAVASDPPPRYLGSRV